MRMTSEKKSLNSRLVVYAQILLLIVLLSELNRTISFLNISNFVPECHRLLSK